jgi:hypothetical protein
MLKMWRLYIPSFILNLANNQLHCPYYFLLLLPTASSLAVACHPATSENAYYIPANNQFHPNIPHRYNFHFRNRQHRKRPNKGIYRFAFLPLHPHTSKSESKMVAGTLYAMGIRRGKP